VGFASRLQVKFIADGCLTGQVWIPTASNGDCSQMS